MNIDWYPSERRKLDNDVVRALEQTAEALRTDLLAQQTVPFAEDSEANRRAGVVPGALQMSIFVDRTRSFSGLVSVVSNTPYARRLYYHPEYNFYQGTNRRAGGGWYEPYLESGKRYNWLLKAYNTFLRKERS